ncbi:MAG: cobyrinate a,c-diamide synthase [Acidimicrobiales bacterium]
MVIAGTHSGVGKTTASTGLMAALTGIGLRVGAAKVGPDYIDPGYHALATGRPSRNLDAWMCGPGPIPMIAAKAAAGCDILVVEGVMGLFDGAARDASSGARAGEGPKGTGDQQRNERPTMVGSTAHVAELLDAPVILVVDAAALSGSVAAVVHGYSTLSAAPLVHGVILNRVGSDSHEEMLRDALVPLGIPVVGALRRDPSITWRDRHLGLVPVIEQPDEARAALRGIAEQIRSQCDLELLCQIARRAPDREITVCDEVSRTTSARVRIAVASGPAFSFSYPDNTEAMEATGAELVPFDPLVDPGLPAGVRGLVVGGGFPEVYAPHLADNLRLLTAVREQVAAGLVTWAECGGLLWLSEALDGHAMAGAIPCRARMTEHRTLGYRTARTSMTSPLGPAGTTLRGHEFHYSVVDPPGSTLEMTGRTGITTGGFASSSLFASYLHQHLAGAPGIAEHFVRRCAGDLSASPTATDA